jgi:hypothetical protein
MRKGTTSTGFEYEYDEQRLDDMRFVDVLAVVLNPESKEFDKIAGVSTLIEMLLGPELKRRLYNHIGQRFGGRVPRAELEKALEEIMKGVDAEADAKN